VRTGMHAPMHWLLYTSEIFDGASLCSQKVKRRLTIEQPAKYLQTTYAWAID
jgi:hypothetical protein